MLLARCSTFLVFVAWTAFLLLYPVPASALAQDESTPRAAEVAGDASAEDLTLAEASDEGWVCPPCGHGAHDTVYAEPGACPLCGMELVRPAEAARAAALGGPRLRAAILLFDGVQIIDYTAPYEVFGQAGFDTYTVSPDGEPITTAMDMRVTPHHSIDSAPIPDILLIPGGQVDGMLADEEVLRWIRDSAAEADHVLSVCTGAFLLAEAGLLDGATATTFHNSLADLARRYPAVRVVRGVRFVDNGKVVTSAGLSAGLDAAIHLVEEIQGRPAAQALADHLEYVWNPEPGEAEPVGWALPMARLHDYDGSYEVEGGGEAIVAASPEDRRLYVFVAGSRYSLVALADDSFLTADGREIVFVRGEDGEVTGYRERTDAAAPLFRRLSRRPDLPPSIWRARPEATEAGGAPTGRSSRSSTGGV